MESATQALCFWSCSRDLTERRSFCGQFSGFVGGARVYGRSSTSTPEAAGSWFVLTNG